MIPLLFVILSAIFYAIFWTLQFHYETSIFSNTKNEGFWNPEISWHNKWKDGFESKGEAFWGSSRWFVFLTDAYHLFQSGYLWCIALAIVNFHPIITAPFLSYCNSTYSIPYQWVVDLLIIKLAFSIIFQIYFGSILVKK